MISQRHDRAGSLQMDLGSTLTRGGIRDPVFSDTPLYLIEVFALALHSKGILSVSVCVPSIVRRVEMIKKRYIGY